MLPSDRAARLDLAEAVAVTILVGDQGIGFGQGVGHSQDFKYSESIESCVIYIGDVSHHINRRHQRITRDQSARSGRGIWDRGPACRTQAIHDVPAFRCSSDHPDVVEVCALASTRRFDHPVRSSDRSCRIPAESIQGGVALQVTLPPLSGLSGHTRDVVGRKV